MRKATRAQWIKFGIITLLYLIFLVWVRSWLGLIVVPFIFDIYISKKIPWSFWKNSKNPAVRSIMSWVDAIVFALVAVYFVNIYIFQNYQIPSSSLEKSLLVGDFLYVSKMSYGPRVPNTPLSMPLAQHTLPVFNTKSYIEWPQWKYKRVPGFGKVKLNDIVVFNFPAGDTVALNRQQEDFYSLAYREGQRIYPNKINMDSLTHDQQRTVYDLYYNAGRNLIRTNPQMYGDIVVRPVDRRENYVKRCVGLPGDTLEIKDTQVYIDGKAIENPEDMQLNYFVQTTGPYIPENMFRELGYDESARPKMERVFQVCRTFAQTFRPGTMNLLLQGGTGLGKTYLSACIARVVAGAGYAVAYETAASALDAFECAKFQRSSADGEAAAQRVEQYLGCDLMILDDLGTEMITAYSTSALYTLINTRLTRKKATIISTNCSNEELQKKYTPQILSRIAGEYQTLPFAGRDIRQIKKEREA